MRREDDIPMRILERKAQFILYITQRYSVVKPGGAVTAASGEARTAKTRSKRECEIMFMGLVVGPFLRNGLSSE
jgi:hypothetical protein